jgi:23S rRNA pseudouridine955/2504/2580 synthase
MLQTQPKILSVMRHQRATAKLVTADCSSTGSSKPVQTKYNVNESLTQRLLVSDLTFPCADRVTFHKISTDMGGQRVDNFLIRLCKGVPKSHIYRIIRAGEVRVNKKRITAETRLQAGDELRVPPLRLARASGGNRPVLPSEFPILWEDEDLLIIDKPAGVAVHGGSGVSFGVIEQLRAARPQCKFLELVHRLDRDTSGVLMLSKKRSALVAMHEQMKNAATEKRYWAVVKGRVLNHRQHVKFSLLKTTDAKNERHVRVVPADTEQAQSAHTIVTVLEHFSDATLVEAQLKTGRTHQIRVHLAHIGHPILGDEKYGDFILNRQWRTSGLRRMFLHAAVLACIHPRTRHPLKVEAPLPPDCQYFLETLRESK